MHEPGVVYEEINFTVADKLLDYLSPSQLLKNGIHSYHYFRGQEDDSWGLLPSALRNKTLKEIIFKKPQTPLVTLITFERNILLIFAKFCDRAGIPIPNDSTSFRKKYLSSLSQEADIYIKDPELWPSPELYEIMAMAQHHGVPTRLLDWSKSPYVAAYFAASGALKNYATVGWEKQKLAIWFMCNNIIESSPSLRYINTPGSVSKHLPAQRGCFSIHPSYAYLNEISTPLGLEKYNFFGDGFILKKLTLPVKESVRLLYLCQHSGFSAAELFPTADGAGRAASDHFLSLVVSSRFNLNFDGTPITN